MGWTSSSLVRDYRASCSDKWTPPPIWTDTVLVAYDALHQCKSLMREARRHLGYSLRVTTAREPLRAIHHLPHAANWFDRAAFEYARAAEMLDRTTLIMEALPETVDLHVATRVFFDIGQHLADIGEALALLSIRLKQRSDDLMADLDAALAEGRPILLGAPVRTIPDRACLLRSRLSERLEALFQRRQRSNAAAPEDAPRKVSRGRAPPLLADCTL